MALPKEIQDELQAISDELIGDTIGVLEAVDQLKKEMDRLLRNLDARDYYMAAQQGYEGLASHFIFLQRCLGGINSSYNDKMAIISQLARERGTSWEEEEPGCNAVMEAMQPKV